MTLVNFRRAICHLQLRRRAPLHLRLFRASAPKLQREFHRALFSHSSSPGEAKVRDPPHLPSRSKVVRFSVQLSAFLPLACARDDVSHASSTSFCSPPSSPQSFPFSFIRTFSQCTHTYTYTHIHHFRIFSRSAGINIYSPVDGALPLGCLEGEGRGEHEPVSGYPRCVLHLCTHTHVIA